MNQSIKKQFFRNATVLLFLFWCHFLFAQDYTKAWDAILKNQFQEARVFLEKARKSPETAADAALTTLILETMEGHEAEEYLLFNEACPNLRDPYPYYFSLWFNEAVVGEYGIKKDHQVKFLEQILADKSCPEMMKASARYHLSHYWITQGEAEKGRKIATANTNINGWQFTGPFENVSECGFDKNYPPVSNPAPSSQFKAINNADIAWFTPGFVDNDGWVMTDGYIRWSMGLIYAQTFINAPSDMEVFVASGFTGTSFKLWVNDRLLLAEDEERRTDFDVYRAPVSLKKGCNRVLVQIGIMENQTTNFSARILDKNGQLVTGLTPSGYKKYPKANGDLPELLPFFAEDFFRKKIKQAPTNPLNYYLLCDVLQRSNKSREALEVTEQILQKYPDNAVFRFQKLRSLKELGNRTALTQEVEAIKQIAPDFLISLVIKYEEAVRTEQYDIAQELLDKWGQLYGQSKDLDVKQVELLLTAKKYIEAIELVKKFSVKYPTDPYFATLQHNVALHIDKSPEAAIKVYTDFLGKNYHLPTAQKLANMYLSLGKNSQAIRVYETIDSILPNDQTAAETLFSYYLNINDEPNAQKWSKKLLTNSPYYSIYWKNAGELAERNARNDEALRCFKKALQYNPNDYDNRRKIRDLEKKPDIRTFLPEKDPFTLYKNADSTGKEVEDGWYYLLDEQLMTLHPEGNQESDNTLVVKVLNETGVDYWKESSIGYDDSRQKLIIEKAEVMKPNGSRITAEKNGNQLVFTNLQAGDGLYIHYRLSSYAYGRMAREFFASYYLNSFVPSDVTRYVLLAPDNIPLSFQQSNVQIKPVIKDLPADKMKEYLWEVRNEPILEREYFAPATCDIAKVIHISSLSSWSEVANWYGDLSASQAKADYDVQQLSAQLFPKGTAMTQMEKVHTIYDWILSNIRYSSVDFRQSGFVPQRASKVIQTKLGDCKDLSTLFAALAREAGIKANLVLVNTRDQGVHSMELPSIEFNHCIVKVMVDKTPYFLELTNPELPFGSLPNNDINAFVLEIPFGKEDAVRATPYLLNPANRSLDLCKEQTQIEISGRDIVVNIKAEYEGNNAGAVRSQFKDLPANKQTEEMQQRLSKKFTNTVTIKKLELGELNSLSDTATFNLQYTVKKEVMEIGGFNSFKIPFFDIFVNADAFTEEKRTQPLCFWKYENSDGYVEEVNVTIPAGKAFAEIPNDIALSFRGMTYKLTYQQPSPETLKVIRTITPVREEFSVLEYPDFRAFIDEVITAETRWVAYK